MQRNLLKKTLTAAFIAATLAVAATFMLHAGQSRQALVSQVSQQAPVGEAEAPAAQPSKLALQAVASVDDSGVPAGDEFQQRYRRGMDMLAADKLVEAQKELSAAVLSGGLSDQDESTAVQALERIAEQTILTPKIFDGDPYSFQYTFQSGQVLQRVERELGLHVPPQFILKINGIKNAASIRAGQTLKMVNGPFHAVVTRHKFTMDLYLHREGNHRIFIKRLRVGLGKDGSTPVGLWRVALGKKLSKAPWNPPPNAQHKHKILWGQPEYPLGTEGYWISLEGLDDNTRLFQGYGIHGTNEPDSIGKEASLGCIRLADPDIDLVYTLLYEHWSTVEIRP